MVIINAEFGDIDIELLYGQCGSLIDCNAIKQEIGLIEKHTKQIRDIKIELKNEIE